MRPLAGGTSIAAGSNPPLFNGESIGHRLRIEFVSRPSLGKPFVEEIRQDDGTDLGAVAAGRTLVRVNVTGFFINGDFEISGGSCDFFNFGTGNQIYIEMPADLDQFG